ncbi:hypothetical protein SCA6_019053 [Theobroma cacao]
MKSWWTIDKFEKEWKEMVKKFALQGHRIDEMYKKKHIWAQSHLSGHCFKTITSTSRCEDYISIHTEPVSSQIFKDIEKHASSVYTRRTFKKFIDEMCLQQLYYHECCIDDEPSIRVYFKEAN